MADEEHGPEYVSEAIRCRACEATAAAANAMRENAKGDPLNGMYFIAREVHRNGHS